MATNVPVTVIGDPTLQLNDHEVAAYASGSGSRMLIFTYTVQPDDVTAGLQVIGLNLPGGSSFADASGNSLTGPFTADLRIALNLTAIMIMNNPSNGDYEIYDAAANHIAAAYSLGRVGAPWTFVGMGTFRGYQRHAVA